MNKKVKIISICSALVVLLGGVILALTSFSENKSTVDDTPKAEYKSGGEPSINPEEEKIKHGLVKDPTAEEASSVSKEEEKRSLEELQKKLDSRDPEEDELDKNDFEAYSILAKYYGSSYNRDTMVDKTSIDYKYMRKMIELLRENKVTENEKTVLVNYIDRRIPWMCDDDDESIEMLKQMEQAVKEYR